MNVLYRVELTQYERSELEVLLSGVRAGAEAQAGTDPAGRARGCQR
jgi:hypothetical protein